MLIPALHRWESYSTLEAMFAPTALTQPDKIQFSQMTNASAAPVPLLAAINKSFATLANEYRALIPDVAPAARDLATEMADSMQISANRASLLVELSAAAIDKPKREAHLDNALEIINATMMVVQRRQARYRVPASRIASWRPSPTAYTFGYLWSASSLYYFWRDYGVVAKKSLRSRSPCYVNYEDPANIAIGQGLIESLTTALRKIFGNLPIADLIADCLASPKDAPEFPKDLR